MQFESLTKCTLIVGGSHCSLSLSLCVGISCSRQINCHIDLASRPPSLASLPIFSEWNLIELMKAAGHPFLFKSGHIATRSAAGLGYSKSFPSGHTMLTQPSDMNSNHERRDARFLPTKPTGWNSYLLTLGISIWCGSVFMFIFQKMHVSSCPFCYLGQDV